MSHWSKINPLALFEGGVITDINKTYKIMCLAIPGKITAIPTALDDIFRVAKVAFGGIQKDVDLSMVPEAQIGDYVLVHVGVAISVVDEEEAKKTFEYLQQIGELEELEPEEGG